MNKFFPLLSVPLTALLVAGSALAQSDSSRINRACTGATLSTDPAALCADDVLNDRPYFPTIYVTRPAPAVETRGSLTTVEGTAIQPGQDVTGIPPGAPKKAGVAPTGTYIGTTSVPARR